MDQRLCCDAPFLWLYFGVEVSEHQEFGEGANRPNDRRVLAALEAAVLALSRTE